MFLNVPEGKRCGDFNSAAFSAKVFNSNQKYTKTRTMSEKKQENLAGIRSLTSEELKSTAAFKLWFEKKNGEIKTIYSLDNGASKRESAAGIFFVDYKKGYRLLQQFVERKLKGQYNIAIIYEIRKSPGGLQVARYDNDCLTQRLQIDFFNSKEGGCEDYHIHPEPGVNTEAPPIDTVPAFILGNHEKK